MVPVPLRAPDARSSAVIPRIFQNTVEPFARLPVLCVPAERLRDVVKGPEPSLTSP